MSEKAAVVQVVQVVDRLNIGFHHLAPRYDRERFRQTVVTLGPSTDEHAQLEGEGIRAVALDALDRKRQPLASLRLARILRAERADIVQTHGFEPSIVGLTAATVARTPVRLLTRHYSDITTLMNKPVHRWLDRRQALWAHRVVAVSHGVEDAMVRLEGVPAGRISVVQYGYDFDELKPVLDAEHRRSLREEMGGDDKLLLATVGRMDWLKGHTYVLQAASRILAEQPDARFVFIGDGPIRDELEREAHDRGIADRVTFLGFRRDAWRLIEAADVVVHPTLTEGFSSVVMESLALERPIVVGDVPGVREQVDDGETGVIIRPRDPDAITAALVPLLADPARRTAMGAEARRRVTARYSIDRWVARTEAIYDELVGRPPSARAERSFGTSTLDPSGGS